MGKDDLNVIIEECIEKGNAYLEESDFKRAEEMFKKSLSYISKFEDYQKVREHFGLGSCYIQDYFMNHPEEIETEQLDKGINELELVVEALDDDYILVMSKGFIIRAVVKSHHLLGKAYFRKGEIELSRYSNREIDSSIDGEEFLKISRLHFIRAKELDYYIIPLEEQSTNFERYKEYLKYRDSIIELRLELYERKGVLN